MDTQQIDPRAVNMAKAIRQHESGGDYSVQGKSGEYGAYQFTEPTWNSYSKQYGINTPLTQATRQQQNEVAVKKINEWITSGKAKNVGEVASMWNAGENAPQAYLQNNVGTNKYGVKFNTPEYAKKVAGYYQQIKNGTLADTPTPQETPVAPEKSLGGFAKNVVSSTGNLIKGLGSVIAHPIKTAENIGNVALGGVENVLGVGEGTKANQAADAVGQFFKDRYGGLDKIGETAYNDPAGFLLDLSSVISGGASVLGKVGDLAKISELKNIAKAGEVAGEAEKANLAQRAAEILQKGADTIDPIAQTGKAIGKLGSKVVSGIGRVGETSLGFTTGVGKTAIRDMYQAGQEGGDVAKAATSAIRGTTQPENIVDNALGAFKNVGKTRSQTYQKNLENISKDTFTSKTGQLYVKKFDPELNKTLFVPTDITTKGVKDATTKAFKDIGVPAKGKSLDFSKSPSLDGKNLQKATDLVYKWDDLTPLGINKLRQEIFGFKKGGVNLSSADKKFNLVITKMGNNIQDYAHKAVPQLEKLNTDYARSSADLTRFRKSLSLGENVLPETTLAKLTSTLKDSANGNLRRELLQELEKQGGGNLEASLAGLALKQLYPKGLARLEAGGLIGGALVHNPALILGVPVTSPRAVGEFVLALGHGSRKLEALAEDVKSNRVANLIKKSGLGATQAGRINRALPNQ